MTMADRADLVGRSTEAANIARALECGVRRIIMTGDAGVGKSALAHQIVQQLRSGRALVGADKHGSDETGAGPMLRAVRSLVEEALEELYEPTAGLEQLRAAMGHARPLFDEIMLSRSTATLAMAHADVIAEQLALVLELTFKWLAGFGAPLVLMIDDWDRASHEVGRLCLRIPDFVPHLPVYLIATGRSRPEFLEPDSAAQSTIPLGGLGPEARLDLLTQYLGKEQAGVIDARLPVSVSRPLDIIQRAEAVAVQLALGRTLFDPETIAAALQDDLPAVVADQFSGLSSDAQAIGLLGAVLGDRTDIALLGVASGLDPVLLDRAVDQLARARIMIRTGREMRFQHDMIRSAILELAEGGGAAASVGKAAARLLSEWQHDQVAQEALGSLLLVHPPSAADRAWVAPLLACIGPALRSLNTDRAARIANLALQLDGGIAVAAQETLKLCAMTSLVSGDRDLILMLSAQLRKLAQSRSDIAFAYALSANAARALGDRQEAIRFSLQGHRLLGWNIPEMPSALSTRLEVIWTNFAGSIMRGLPLQAKVPDRDMVALSATTSTIFYEFGTPHVVCVARRFALSRTTRTTSAGLTAAVFMANFMKFNRLASRLGSRVLAQDGVGEENWPPSAYRANFFGRLWTNPARSFDLVHDDLHTRALAEGDLVVAAWVLRNKAQLHWRAGGNLADFERLALDAMEFATRVGNRTSAAASAQMLVAARMLQGLQFDPDVRIDPYCPHTLETPLLTWLAYHNLRGDFEQSMHILARLPRKVGISLASHPGVRDFRFHRAVAMLATRGEHWPEDVRAVVSAARLCPGDNSARLLIVRAMLANSQGRAEQAYRQMAEAARTSLALQRPHEASLAWLFAANYAQAVGRHEDAGTARDQARRAWTAWGANVDIHPRLQQDAAPESAEQFKALASRLEQAERENRAKSRLLALVGHELRTPMQAMSGAADLIRAQAGGSRDLSIVSASIDRLSAMVDDLSAVTALEAGELAINPQAFNLANLLRDVLTTHAEPLKAAGMSMALEAQADDIWLHGDNKRLQQVLDNLLNNARKYGAGEVLLKVSHCNNDWVFEVADEGTGLSPEQVVRIFEPFVRGASVGAAPGHGIGLWLSRKLAENMGGQLILAPPDPRMPGTRFLLTLTLPRAKQSREIDGKTIIEAKRIVLIEDEPLSRDVIERLLALDGHHVSAFESGKDALSALSSGAPHFDFIIVDGNLPDMSGLETVSLLRNIAGLAKTTVAMVTAQVTDEHLRAQQDGLLDVVVQKPVSLHAIRKIIGGVGPAAAQARVPQLDEHARAYFAAYLQSVEASATQADWDLLRADAHKLAGAAMMYQFVDLGAVALDLEECAGKNDKAGTEYALERVRHEFETIQSALPLLSH